MADNRSMRMAPHLRHFSRMRTTLMGLSRTRVERMHLSMDAVRSAAHATRGRASIIFGVGAERDRGSESVAPGEAYPVHCPRCGSRTRRIQRWPTDRLLSAFFTVWRFRCINSACGWEDPVRMRNTDFKPLL